MIRTLTILLLAMTSISFARENLDKCYCISFGDPNAEIKITEYFSFSCPQCIRLFNKDFIQIKKEYVETRKIYWTFHPVPMDLTTIQAMDCLEKLNDKQKQAFLEAILSQAQGTTTHQLMIMMKKGVEILGIPLPDLEKLEYLKQTEAFRAAFSFVAQHETITEVPTYEINGNLQIELPEKPSIDRKIKEYNLAHHFESLLPTGKQS